MTTYTVFAREFGGYRPEKEFEQLKYSFDLAQDHATFEEIHLACNGIQNSWRTFHDGLADLLDAMPRDSRPARPFNVRNSSNPATVIRDGFLEGRTDHATFAYRPLSSSEFKDLAQMMLK